MTFIVVFRYLNLEPLFYQLITVGEGFLVIMAKPTNSEGIKDEFAALEMAHINHIVSLLEDAESYEVGLENERQLCEAHEITFESFPIPDGGVPDSINEFRLITLDIYKKVVSGINTAIHCWAGIGRTAMMAGGVLLHCGFNAVEAFDKISEVRGVPVPETDEQFEWLLQYEKEVQNHSRNH